MKKRRWHAVSMDIHGIKCDTPQCGWEDMTVRPKDYRAWLNRPCPNCGGNLLTADDMRAVRILQVITFLFNVFLGWKGLIHGVDDKVAHAIEMDGTGKLKVGELSKPVDEAMIWVAFDEYGESYHYCVDEPSDPDIAEEIDALKIGATMRRGTFKKVTRAEFGRLVGLHNYD